MTYIAIEGGTRDRLIFESFHRWLHDGLDALNWFAALTPGPSITWLTEPVADRTQVLPNTIVVSVADSTGVDIELGSGLTEDTTQMWVEMYAADDAIGNHVMGDVRDLCRGKMPSIGYDEPHFLVKEWRATNVDTGIVQGTELFWVEMQDVSKHPGGLNPASPELRHWWGVSLELVEERD